MPFLAQEKQHIPTKDLISWIFDDQTYDQDKPVCGAQFASKT
jgi:4-coumarate--CoA ligase